MTLEAIKYTRGSLNIIDQLKLPHHTEYVPITTSKDGYHAIYNMIVRGAPAIAIVAALSLAVELHSIKDQLSSLTSLEVQSFINSKLDYLNGSRPTAVNLSDAVRKLKAVVAGEVGKGSSSGVVVEVYISEAEAMLEKDVEDNKNIGKFGTEWLLKVLNGKEKISVLTHCNTGSLATAGYGTALGIIRSLWSAGKLSHVYCTETRPYNQGSRLTAYELIYEKIPSTLITDSMAAATMQLKGIDAVIVGADRVVKNGDTANKIGTYQLAILAKYHNVKFVVAAPTTSIDLETGEGEKIVIEQRSWDEVVKVRGPCVVGVGGDELVLDRDRLETVCTAAQGISVFNPAFDVTPAELIDAIITEKGAFVKEDGVKKFKLDVAVAV